MRKIDLNCDCGEGFGIYQFGQDEKIMKFVSSVNIACGLHAGDPFVIAKTVQLAREQNVAVGAHPGFPDLMGFGRREITLTNDEIYNLVIYQIGVMQAFCKSQNIQLHHVKPHGALYNLAARDMNIARAIVRAIKDLDSQLILYGLAKSKLVEAADEVNLPYASEVFADRVYLNDGNLMSRNLKGSVHENLNNMIEQALTLITEGNVTCDNGEIISLNADTICSHGDNANAYQFVKTLRDRLQELMINVCPVGSK
jgi:UPF0271 protein